jgi:hypothetical protein
LTEPDQGEKFIPIAIGEPWSDNISEKAFSQNTGRRLFMFDSLFKHYLVFVYNIEVFIKN